MTMGEFTEFTGNKIGRITPAGDLTEFPIPVANSDPDGISPGPFLTLAFVMSEASAIQTDTNRVTMMPSSNLMTALPQWRSVAPQRAVP